MEKFFNTHWYRQTLLEELGLPEITGSSEESNKNGSFEELRRKVAIKWLGEKAVNSKEFKKRELEHQIKVSEFCIKRDSANRVINDKQFGKGMFKNRKSLLPGVIREERANLRSLKRQLNGNA